MQQDAPLMQASPGEKKNPNLKPTEERAEPTTEEAKCPRCPNTYNWTTRVVCRSCGCKLPQRNVPKAPPSQKRAGPASVKTGGGGSSSGASSGTSYASVVKGETGPAETMKEEKGTQRMMSSWEMRTSPWTAPPGGEDGDMVAISLSMNLAERSQTDQCLGTPPRWGWSEFFFCGGGGTPNNILRQIGAEFRGRFWSFSTVFGPILTENDQNRLEIGSLQVGLLNVSGGGGGSVAGSQVTTLELGPKKT